jgi:hypothetical protein
MSKSVSAVVAGGARWWAVFTVLFFFTFPLWGRGLLAVLRFVLEGLNSFGSGY